MLSPGALYFDVHVVVGGVVGGGVYVGVTVGVVVGLTNISYSSNLLGLPLFPSTSK